jgi:hypothetical protein
MRPISRIAFLILVVAVALPAATAHAGGWATVEVDSQPVGLTAGKPWRVELLVKQHGVTPLDGVTPSVRIDNGAGVVRTFKARPTGRPGTYAAVVTYPSAGTWQTRLFDGFTDATPHRLAPVEIPAPGDGVSAMAATFERSGPPALTVDDSGPPWPQIVSIGVVALAFLVAIVACGPPPAWRRRGRTPVPQQYLPTQ